MRWAEINQAGGVLGMPVEFVYREELTEDVVQSATELVEDENVVAILGPLFSSHAVKVGPVATVPVLLGATGANVTETGDFLFLVASSNALQAKLMAQFAVDELGAKTAAMIWQNEDVYSIGFVEAFETNFMELGGDIVAKEIYETGDTMFETQLSAIKDANPDVLFLASFPPEVPLLMQQAREMGIESTFIGSDGWDDSLMFENMDAIPHLENSYYCTNFDPEVTTFISAYEMMFDNPANGDCCIRLRCHENFGNRNRSSWFNRSNGQFGMQSLPSWTMKGQQAFLISMRTVTPSKVLVYSKLLTVRHSLTPL